MHLPSWSQHSSASNGASAKVAVVSWLPCAGRIEWGAFGGCVQITCRRAHCSLELAGPNSDLAAHRTPLVLLWCLQRDWMSSSPSRKLKNAIGKSFWKPRRILLLRSATRTDSDQNHTSQALELAAGGCGNSIKRASDSRTEAPSQPARSSWRRAGLSHSGAVAAASLQRRADSA